MSAELEHRIVELETRLEFQDQTIAHLNDALVKYGRGLNDLQGTVKLLIEKYREAQTEANEPESDGPEPPPPHY
jgi:SlyX protein